jgi:hypothetical protein
MKISRIRLSDKTSRLHPRHVVPKPAQAHEPEVPVKVREWIRPALASPDLVLEEWRAREKPSGLAPVCRAWVALLDLSKIEAGQLTLSLAPLCAFRA